MDQGEVIVGIDVSKDRLDVHVLPSGEVFFVPRQGASGELDGYYMNLARGLPDDRSWLYIWDAADFPCAPVAKVAIPATVPNGLHANWFPRHT